MRTTLVLAILLWTIPGWAVVQSEQTIPDRPLVLESGNDDGSAGLHFALQTDPEVGFADMVHVPVSVAWGLGSGFEVGLRLDTLLQPAVATALTPRVRLGFGQMQAVGLAVTLPFGYFSDGRLGPSAVPVELELPAFRMESSAGALQAVLGWHWAFQEGADVKGLDAEIAGVLRFGENGFALVDLGLIVANAGEAGTTANLEAGLGIGWRITQRNIVKMQIFTPDFVAFNDTHFLVLFVHRWRRAPEPTADDWL